MSDPKKTLLDKSYSGESIVDVERDVLEAITDSDVPKDEYGFHKGMFRVALTWEEA